MDVTVAGDPMQSNLDVVGPDQFMDCNKCRAYNMFELKGGCISVYRAELKSLKMTMLLGSLSPVSKSWCRSSTAVLIAMSSAPLLEQKFPQGSHLSSVVPSGNFS